MTIFHELTPGASMGWMDKSACSQVDLPWITDTAQLSPGVVEKMRQTCAACPVLHQCADFAVRTHVNAGWWAGADWSHGRRRGAEVEPAPQAQPIPRQVVPARVDTWTQWTQLELDLFGDGGNPPPDDATVGGDAA